MHFSTSHFVRKNNFSLAYRLAFVIGWPSRKVGLAPQKMLSVHITGVKCSQGSKLEALAQEPARAPLLNATSLNVNQCHCSSP